MAQTLDYNKSVTNVYPVVPTLDEDMFIISKLDDEPNDVGGLSADQLKAEFDKAGRIISDYINTGLIPAVLASDLTEQTRAAAEAERVTNEQERVSNENKRIADETARKSAEDLRVTHENERVAAENIRNENETLRVSNEQQRIINEAERQDLERGYVAQSKNNADAAIAAKNAAEKARDEAKEIVAGDFIPASQKGAPNGVASLGNDGKVPAAQLPSTMTPAAHAETHKQDGSDPLTPEDIGAGRVNPNLLHNWYFANPVNQRGQAEYNKANGTNGYSIDRWIANNSKVTFDGAGAVVSTDGKSISNACFMTSVENPAQYVGKEVTISFLVTENNLSGNIQFGVFYGNGAYNQTSHAITYGTISAGQTGVFSVTGVLKDMGSYAYMNPFIRVAGAQNGDFTVLAAKLELGTQQTLAHQDADGNWVLNEIPDYGEQLAICQRYAVKIGGTFRYRACQVAGNIIDFAIPLPQTMRLLPSIDLSALILYSFVNGTLTAQTGFEFTKQAITSTGIVIRATKTAHGVTDAVLGVDMNTILSADL